MPTTDMTGQEVASASAAASQSSRMAERVAALETRTAIEIGILKEDTKAIRSMIHDANNKMQILVGAEERFTVSVRGIEVRFADQAEQIKKLIGTVEGLVEMRTRAAGAWWLVGRMSLVLGFVGSGIAAAATTVWWALSHLTIKP